MHFNSDYPAEYAGQNDTLHRSSDHAPLVVRFVISNHTIYLPLWLLNKLLDIQLVSGGFVRLNPGFNIHQSPVA